MKSKTKITNEIAECVGLWLAEGDKKTEREITFTNNCIPLIELFGFTIQKQFQNYPINPRTYIYSAKNEKIQLAINCKRKYYTDVRANSPYIIYRVASVKVVKEWKRIVSQVKNEKKYHKDILKGFFAGEGNIKEGSHSNRTIRIAQGKRDAFIEKILKHLGITYRYSKKERTYIITGKWNWEKFAKMKIADLHPEKRMKFYRIFNDYKEEHYPNNYIRKKIRIFLKEPQTTSDISKKFKRSFTRIQDILIPLKKENEIQVFRVRSKTYWINTNQNKIIISKIKEKYLKSLTKKRKTIAELSKEMNVCWKSSHRKLLELQKLNLVVKDTNGMWKHLYSKKEVIVL